MFNCRVFVYYSLFCKQFSLGATDSEVRAIRKLLPQGTVTLCNVSYNFSRNALGDNLYEKLNKTTGRVTAQRSGKLLEVVAESRVVFYFPQRFLQLVSQRISGRVFYNLTRNVFGRCKVCYTLQCFVRLVSQRVRDKFYETLQSVTAP